MPNKKRLRLMGALTAVVMMASVHAQQEHNPNQHMQHMPSMSADPALVDTRAIVHFPEQMRIHTLANMRDHLLALSEIQEALAHGKFEKAGEIAEQRLGMTAMKRHGAHEIGPYMPKAMAAIGTEMHHAASRFAVTANDAAVSVDLKPALSALSEVVQQCVACHSAFRVQ